MVTYCDRELCLEAKDASGASNPPLQLLPPTSWMS